MVIVELCGGLGNQLFQYSFGKYLGDTLNYQVKFDTHWFKKPKKAHEELLLDRLGLDVPEPGLSASKSLLLRSRFLRKLGGLPATLTGFRIIKESTKNTHQDNSYYIGFWQNAKYANHIAELIKKNVADLDFNLLPQQYAENITENSIAVHVRRGDYLTNKNFGALSHAHLVLDANYYKTEVERALKIRKKANIHVFSDDIDWCEKSLGFENRKVYYWNAQEMNTIDTFVTMSKFRAYILSPSTFGWWPAFINKEKSWFISSPQFYELSAGLLR